MMNSYEPVSVRKPRSASRRAREDMQADAVYDGAPRTRNAVPVVSAYERPPVLYTQTYQQEEEPWPWDEEGQQEDEWQEDELGEPQVLHRLPVSPPRPTLRPVPRSQLGAWDDTSAIPKPWLKRRFSRQSPFFWITSAVLMIAMFVVVGTLGVRKWQQMDAERQEARRLQQIADEKAKYKLVYRDLIEQYAYENGIEPAAVAAVIYNESRFQPKAESYLRARGLMQIMPDTGEWIAEILNDKGSYSFDDMFVPETNIRYGTWYLGFLARKFDNDLIKIAAGYHAGQNAVDSWLSDPRYSSDGKTLQYIPPEYESTDDYVKGVVTAYGMYRKHYYAPEEPAPEGGDAS